MGMRELGGNKAQVHTINTIPGEKVKHRIQLTIKVKEEVNHETHTQKFNSIKFFYTVPNHNN